MDIGVLAHISVTNVLLVHQIIKNLANVCVYMFILCFVFFKSIIRKALHPEWVYRVLKKPRQKHFDKKKKKRYKNVGGSKMVAKFMKGGELCQTVWFLITLFFIHFATSLDLHRKITGVKNYSEIGYFRHENENRQHFQARTFYTRRTLSLAKSL